jgi:hypothetical protein
MPKYPGNQLSDEIMVRHAGLYGSQTEVVVAASRAWKGRCRDRLFDLGRALEAWARYFETPAVIALGAASVTRDSLHRLLARIAAECGELEPASPSSTHNGDADDAAVVRKRKLENYAAVLEHLSEFVCGTKQCFPAGRLEDVDKQAEWDYEIEPPDIETEAFVLRFVQKAVRHAENDAAGALTQVMHLRLAELASMAVRRLIDAMNLPYDQKGAGGLDLAGVESAVRAQPDNEHASAVHAEMCTTVDELAALAEAHDPGVSSVQQWSACTERLVACWDDWAGTCAKLHTKVRATRQAKKEILRRHVACIKQYADLMSGNEAQLRFIKTVLCLNLIGGEIMELLVKLDRECAKREAQPSEEVTALVREFSRLVVDDAVERKWRSQLEGQAKRAGMAIRAITEREGGQERPWKQGDKRSLLLSAGVLAGDKKRTPAKQFESLFYAMQQVGLAVQIPWDFLDGKKLARKHNGKKLHAGEYWLINPLGSVLADKPNKTKAAAAKVSHSSVRKRATKKASTKLTKKKTRGA